MLSNIFPQPLGAEGDAVTWNNVPWCRIRRATQITAFSKNYHHV